MRRALVPLVFLMSCTHESARPPATRAEVPTAAVRPRANVLVTIVVDQMAAWIASERWPLLPQEGGFARLRREGTWVKELRYAHAATDTAPGHASLYTGVVPRGSGIFGNEVIDAKSEDRVSILRDTSTKLVTKDGPIEATGSSSAALLAPVVADAFRNTHPDALILSISLKDRGAIAGAGTRPTAAIWYDRSEGGRFVTSTAFANALPSWVPRESPVKSDATWTLLDEAWVKSHAATPDTQAGEGDLGGMGTTFPHSLKGLEAPSNAFRATPFADDALLAMGLAALDAEHAAEHPTLLALSLSANDYVGHTFGPDSWEAWDELRRLDASLARFFAALDTRFGAEGWSAMLSADHGVTTMPEAAAVAAARPWCGANTPDHWQRPCGAAGRLMPDELTKELRAAAKTAVGAGTWVRGVADPYVFLTPDVEGLGDAKRAKLVAALTKALAAHPEVDRVIDTRSLPPSCAEEKVDDTSIDPLVCRSYAGGAGALYVLSKAGSFFDPSVVAGKGTSHGTPYLFDRAVPLLARAPGRIPAGEVIDEPLSFRTFARTAAALLAVSPPLAAQDARNLVTLKANPNRATSP